MTLHIKNKKLLIPVAIIAGFVVLYLSYAAYSYLTNSQSFNAGSSYSYINVSGQTPGQAKDSIDESIGNKNVTITTDEVTIDTNPSEIGVEASEESLAAAQQSIRLKSAFLPFFYKANIDNVLAINTVTFKNVVQSKIPTEHNPAQNSTFIVKDKLVAAQPSKDGNGIEPSTVEVELLSKLNENISDITIATELVTVEPAISQDTLSSLKLNAETIFKNSYLVNSKEKEYKLENTKIIEQLITNPGGTQLLLPLASANNIVKTASSQVEQQKVDEVTTIYKSGKTKKVTTNGQNGTKVSNLDDLSNKLVEAVTILQNYKEELSFSDVKYAKKEVVVDDTIKTANYTYSITTWGTTKSNLDDFANKVAQTLADGRGWAQAGATFTRVSSGADFDIVLSEPAELPARYPGTCDSTYSCRVGRYVIINDDRWRGATPSWNEAGGSLRNYQHMVVNHEVGHRLGRGHQYCSAPGQAAPIMQQQSISLQGCTFNPWPLPYEISAVQRSL